jgi:AcrR family transcriptional regulator
MARAGLDSESILETAANMVDRHGLTSLTITGLAAELKIRPPSLYSHFDGLAAIEDGLTLMGLKGLLDASLEATAGVSVGDALEALARAHRAYAKAHPGVYAATLRHAEDRTPEIRAAGAAYLKLVLTVLQGFGLVGDPALHAARCLHGSMRGFIMLEQNGGMGLAIGVEDSFEMLLRLMRNGLIAAAQPTRGGRAARLPGSRKVEK